MTLSGYVRSHALSRSAARLLACFASAAYVSALCSAPCPRHGESAGNSSVDSEHRCLAPLLLQPTACTKVLGRALRTMGNPCGCTKSDCNSACFRAFLRTPSTDLTAFMQELTRSSPIFRVESFAASRIALTRAIRLKSPKLQERGPTADLGPPASKHFIEMFPTWIWLGEHTQHEVLPAGLCDVATCGQHLLTAMRDATSSRADSKLTRRLCSGLANLSACMALGTALRFRTLLKRYPNVFPNERRQPRIV